MLREQYHIPKFYNCEEDRVVGLGFDNIHKVV